MNQKRQLNRGTIASLAVLLLAIPLTLWISRQFGNRNYYLTSVLVLLYIMVPFFLTFERRKPQAREMVFLAVMCAIAVASRSVFIWLPYFKPMTAIIILTGIAFGAEAGFLTGAVSGFVSDFFFGQGPWTPWQMFAFGVAGFLAGFLYRRGFLSKNRLSLCLFGAAVVLLLVGPLLDTCTLFTMSSVIETSNILAVYLAGLPVNAMHALATALTLLLVSKPMLEKLDRVKLKYGMTEE